MERGQNTQLDLFNSPGSRNTASLGYGRLLLGNGYNRDKKILLLIAFIVIGIVSFSLGVEKGKRIALKPATRQQEAVPATSAGAVIVNQAPKVMPGPAVRQEALPAQVAEAPAVVSPKGKFTIQVATFRTKALAKQEADFLKKKGFSAGITAKGSYCIVCVGSFRDKDSAKGMFSKLQPRYNDCFIRRL